MIRLSRTYAPRWHQQRLHHAREEGHVYRWLCAGVGSGKTWSGLEEDWDLATEVCPGKAGLIVVTGYRVLRETFVPIIRRMWPAGAYRLDHLSAEPQIVIPTPQGDSVIYVRSAKDAGTVEDINSLTVAWAHLDEVGRSRVGHLAWRYTLERLREPAPYNGVHITSSPRPGWLPKEWGVRGGLPPEACAWRGGDGYAPKPGYWVIQARSEDNTFNPASYAARLRAVFGESSFARQELDGSIEQATGLLFPEWVPGLHVISSILAEQLTHGHPREGGIDWGWNTEANVWGAWIEGGSTFVVLGEWYEHGRHDEEQIAAAASVPGVDTWFADPEDPGSIEKARHGAQWQGRVHRIDCRPAEKPFRPSVDALRNLMERRPGRTHPNYPLDVHIGAPRLLVSTCCENLIREIGELRDARDPEDPRPQAAFKTTGDDHAVDALRYLVWNSYRMTETRTTWIST